jgi:hypothetical protein
MMLLAKAAGIAVLVWFYMTAKKQGENPVKWAIVGVIGFWVAWWAVKLTLLDALVGVFSKGSAISFMITQIPAIVGLGAAVLIRKKLLADSAEKKQ